MSEDFPLGKKFYLMRHGQTKDNKDGLVSGGGREPKLTKQGRQESAEVREIIQLLDQPINLVVTSELKRTKHTAKIAFNVNSMRDIPRIEDSGINEIARGKAEGMSEDKLRELKSDGTSIEGEESKEKVRNRAVEAIKKNIDGDKTTLFVTHGGIIARMFGVALGGEEAVDMVKKYGDIIGSQSIKNCGVYEFVTPKKPGGEWEVNELTLDRGKIKAVPIREKIENYKLLTSRKEVAEKKGGHEKQQEFDRRGLRNRIRKRKLGEKGVGAGYEL